MRRKGYEYEIDGSGRDNSTWSSRPASDRINGLNGSFSDTTDDLDSSSGCGCEIDPADREKRIDELDELIHDKIGDNDDRLEHKYHDKDYSSKHKDVINDKDYQSTDNLRNTASSAMYGNNDRKDSKVENRLKDNITDGYSYMMGGDCGCGSDLVNETDSNQYNISANRIDDSGDNWIVERIDIWVDDTADDLTNSEDDLTRTSRDRDIKGQNQQQNDFTSRKENDLNSTNNNGFSCKKDTI